MVKRRYLFIGFILIIAVICSGCDAGNDPPEEVEISTATSPPQVEAPTQEVAAPPTLTPIPEIVHQNIPENPSYLLSQFIRDCNTGKWIVAGEDIKRSYACDSWTYNAVERPYDEEYQTFYPEFDILTMQFGQDETWFYVRFEVFENSSMAAIAGVYGVELDLNLDLRGDVLILANNPAQGEWTVDGVEIWRDVNTDNGALQPLVADYSPETEPGDGYEVFVFEAGEGDDADAGWARIDPEDKKVIEIAFKRSLINNDQAFEWWGWASMNPLVAGDFDLHDHYTDTDVFAIDNSCGWLFGLNPDTTIPNLCYIEPTPTLTPEPDVVFVCPGPPAEGCGNPANTYFEEESCQCITCPAGQLYDVTEDKCVVYN